MGGQRAVRTFCPEGGVKKGAWSCGDYTQMKASSCLIWPQQLEPVDRNSDSESQPSSRMWGGTLKVSTFDKKCTTVTFIFERKCYFDGILILT